MNTVKLIAVTKPLLEGVATAEDFIAYAARVSNPSNQMNTATSGKLLNYLVVNKHWSPFEMVHVVMEINTTRDIARQILRHRSFSFQEFSQRYANAGEMGFTLGEARMQDVKNRQASNETEDQLLKNSWQDVQQTVLNTSEYAYTWAINNGIAKEVARKVLPEGITNSRLYMAGTLRSWLHYCAIRTDVATQKEHREIADQALYLLEKEFSSIAGLINDIQ